jgi:ubiquinone/menaquinone biosynthesis C-methylase UbiE
VLDVGCGTGNWLIEAAKAYPTMSLLIGIDISAKMVKYACEQAEEQQVNDRVEFHTMDALRLLEFPDKYFDLVNLRLGVSYLRTWDWPKLLQELQRVTRSGGVIRQPLASWVNCLCEHSIRPGISLAKRVKASYRS